MTDSPAVPASQSPPEDDLVIPDEEVQAGAEAIAGVGWHWLSAEMQQRSLYHARVALEAAARVRTHATEVATTVGYAQGRAEACDEVAKAIEAEFDTYGSYADQILGRAAKIARQIGARKPTAPPTDPAC